MKKQILISLILLCFALTINAQIQVPAGGASPMYINNVPGYGYGVGIGTSHPASLLDINGFDGVAAKVRVSTPRVGGIGGYFEILMNEDRYAAGMHAYVPSNQPGVDRVFLGLYTTTSESSFNLQTRIERLTISDKGDVGIGTVNPAYKLDVIGTIRAREIKVDLNGADFVFEKDYKLMPLTELERFVKEQKHLPEISPAKEMKENGTELGDLNSKLLQKIEELTLYIIDQQKQIDELKNRSYRKSRK